jgi:hypothetical protein
MVKACIYWGGSNGSAAVDIFPKLIGQVDEGAQVFYGAQVTMNALFDADTHIGISYSDGILTNLSGIRLVERL